MPNKGGSLVRPHRWELIGREKAPDNYRNGTAEMDAYWISVCRPVMREGIKSWLKKLENAD